MAGTVPSELSSSFKVSEKTLTERKRRTAAQIGKKKNDYRKKYQLNYLPC